MPILRVSPQERKLIPLELQAQYELGRVSKKELDEYLHGQLKHIESSPENKDYRDSLKAEYGDVKKLPDGLGDDNWDAMVNAPIEDVVTKYMSASNQITDWNSQYAEARNEDKRYAFLDRLVNEPGFYENELSNIEAEAADAQLDPRASSDARGRLLALQQSKKEADKLSKTGELYDRRNKALSKQQIANEKLREQEFKIKAYEDYFERTGSYGKRTLADMGSNWESLLPLAGSIVGGAIGTAIEPGGGTTLGTGIGSAALSGPIYNKAYNAALTSALRGNVPDNEAEAFATAMAGSEALIEAVAGRFGAGGSTARSIIKDALYKRFGKKFITGAASEFVEELAVGALQETGGAAVLAADQASPELQAIIAGQVPMKADGTVDYDAYLGQKARGAISGAAAGGTLAGGMSPLTIYQENKSVAKQTGAAKEALAQRKEQLQQLGFKGTDLANQLAQEANVLSATVGVDSADIFTAKDFVPEEVKIDEEIFAQSKKDLEESIRLRPNDPFTAGQIQGMQLVEQNKSVLDADRFKGTPDWQGQKVSPSAIPLPGDLGAFAVEAPTQSQGWSTATPQPTAEVTVGKPRVNLTERSGGFKPAEQSAPTVTKTTATTNLPLEKRSRNMVQTRDKLLQDVQKFAGTKIDPKAIDKQKTKIGAALAEAERQLNFEGAFEGLDANQQEDTLRKKALEFLSSGKKIEDIQSSFDKATEDKQNYRQTSLDAAGKFLTESDETRTRLGKSLGSPELVDNLVKNGKIVVVPSFEGKKAPDGTVLQDANQAFVWNGDTVFVNGARLGDKKAQSELAYAVVAHEYTHKKEKLMDFTGLNKKMVEMSGQAGRLGDIARAAIKRADDAVARGEVKKREQEAPQYFIEELLTNYKGPLGPVRKYVDQGMGAVRSALSNAGLNVTVRPQDLAYIIGKDIKREAQGKPPQGVKKKDTPQGKPKATPEAGAKAKVQNSFAYRGSLKASKEIREGKGTIDPVYDEPVVEFSDKDAKFDYKKFSDAGLTGKMGEVYDHPELYEYYPSLKDAKLNVDKDIKWNEGYYNSSTNTITISDRAFNTLNYPAEPGTSADKAKQKVLEETNSIIIHEIQHAIQNRRGFNAKGSNQAAEADLYRRSAYTRPNLTELKESRVDRAADWAYRANAGEIMARAAEYAYKGKMPDGTPVANGIEAAKIIKAQFAKTIKSPQDRKEFFEWFDKEIADTDKMVRFSTAPQTNTLSFKQWFKDSKVVDKEGKPLVVYHGTSQEFSRFDKGRLGDATGAPSAKKGFFFTENPEVASGYARATNRVDSSASYEKMNPDKPDYTIDDVKSLLTVSSTTLGSIYGNPLTGETKSMFPINRVAVEMPLKRVWEEMSDGKNLVKAIEAADPGGLVSELLGYTMKVTEAVSGANVLPVYLSLRYPLVHDFKGEEYREVSYNSLLKRARTEGHDGVILKNTIDDIMDRESGDKSPHNVYVVFEPTQIKSATGNKGTFDPNNSDIRFSTASDVIKNTIKSITNNKYVKGATVGMTPDKARIIDETSKNVTKLFEARMNYAIRNLQKAANNSKTPWEKIEAGWKRMIETKTLKPVTGDKNVDGALADMRIQIDSLSKQFETTFKEAGVPIPEKLKETIEANLRSYISRSFDIDYNQNYGKDYLNEVKKDPDKKKKLDNLIRFFQVGLVRDLQNLGTLDDERVKQIHDMLVGAGSPSIAEKRADLKAFVGSRKQSELTEALVNDVLRLNKTNKLAGFYRGSSRDTSILKTRKDVPQAIREVWGERTGVLEGAMTTIIRQARLIAETQAQADLIKRIPEDFSKTATSTLTERIDNSVDKYGPLAGMYTTPDMKNYVTERVQQYETTDSLLFDIHSVQTQNKAAADTIVGLFNQYAKRIGQLKGWTVLGELINYPYNLIGMVQAAVFKGPNSVTYTDSKGNKVPISNWGKQFVYDLIKGEVGPKTTELYQEMVKYGMLGSALTGDIQEAFVTELKHNSSLPKKVWNGFGHFFNVAFGGPELLSTGLTFVNEANFLRDLWTAQGKKFTHDELMMEAADRTKRTTISRDRAMVFAKFGDRLGPSTYFTFFSETIRAPITNIIMANQMRKSAEGMNPEAAKLAKNYALRQFVGGVVGISLTLAIHNLLGKLMGSGFGDEPDEVAEALPEGMRVGAEGLLVLGQDNGGVKFLYNPDMANTYSALFDPIKSAIKGNFADAGKQLMDLQFVNPVVRQAYRAANGELGPSEDGFTADVNTFLSEIGLANSGFTIPFTGVEPFAPQTVSRIPKLSAGVEPSAIRPLWDLAWGTKDASDFGGALGLTMTLLGARPYRYAPKKSADWSITKVGEQSKEMVSNLNEVVRNRNNSKATIKAQVERFYNEEYEMLKEHYKVIKAAKAAGMTNDELKTLMKGAFLSKTLIASLLSDTGDYYMTEFGGTWLEISEMKKILNMTPKEEALTLEGYRANKEIFFEVFKEKFGTKEK